MGGDEVERLTGHAGGLTPAEPPGDPAQGRGETPNRSGVRPQTGEG